jgi:hypothetical protein
MTAVEFLEKKHRESKIDYGMLPPPTSAKEALEILTVHFLGDGWYTVNPMCTEQVYTEIVASILDKTQPKSFFKRLFEI